MLILDSGYFVNYGSDFLHFYDNILNFSNF